MIESYLLFSSFKIPKHFKLLRRGSHINASLCKVLTDFKKTQISKISKGNSTLFNGKCLKTNVAMF